MCDHNICVVKEQKIYFKLSSNSTLSSILHVPEIYVLPFHRDEENGVVRVYFANLTQLFKFAKTDRTDINRYKV